MKAHNPDCDGDCCVSERGVVRAIPLGGGSQVYLCQNCAAVEGVDPFMFAICEPINASTSSADTWATVLFN